MKIDNNLKKILKILIFYENFFLYFRDKEKNFTKFSMKSKLPMIKTKNGGDNRWKLQLVN